MIVTLANTYPYWLIKKLHAKEISCDVHDQHLHINLKYPTIN